MDLGRMNLGRLAKLDAFLIERAREIGTQRHALEQELMATVNEIGKADASMAAHLDQYKQRAIAAGRGAGTIDEHIERLMEQAFEKKTAA